MLEFYGILIFLMCVKVLELLRFQNKETHVPIVGLITSVSCSIARYNDGKKRQIYIYIYIYIYSICYFTSHSYIAVTITVTHLLYFLAVQLLVKTETVSLTQHPLFTVLPKKLSDHTVFIQYYCFLRQNIQSRAEIKHLMCSK